jgi:RecB family exonuclease
MTRPVVFSASSITRYRECELAWYFSYVLADPGSSSVQSAIGIAVHDGVAVLLRAKRDGRLTEVDEHGDWYDKAVAEMVESLSMNLLGARTHPKLTIEAAFASAALCFDRYFEDVFPLIDPVMVEEPFQFEVDGIPYSGVIDAGDGAVRDLKTTGSRPSSGDRYDFAMIGYAVGYRRLTGHIESDRILDYIVRTQHPYYWPIRLGPATNEDIDQFANIVGEVDDGVRAGRFRPTGLDKRSVCVSCPHQARCEPYQNLQAIRGESDAAAQV